MNLLDGISHMFDTVADAKRMAHLLSLSDRELAARGLTRADLKQRYLDALRRG